MTNKNIFFVLIIVLIATFVAYYLTPVIAHFMMDSSSRGWYIVYYAGLSLMLAIFILEAWKRPALKLSPFIGLIMGVIMVPVIYWGLYVF